MWCSRRMEKTSWTDHVRNEEILHKVKEERNTLHTINRRKVNWTCHILCRNCLLKHVIEGNTGEIGVMGRWNRRCKQVLNNLKEIRRNWKFKEGVFDRTLWRACFVRGFGLVARQITHEWMNEWINEQMNYLCKSSCNLIFSSLKYKDIRWQRHTKMPLKQKQSSYNLAILPCGYKWSGHFTVVFTWNFPWCSGQGNSFRNNVLVVKIFLWSR